MVQTTSPPTPVLGWLGFALGAVALILTIALFWAGPFAPQQTAGVTLGELAAEIAKSAARSVAGQPKPAPDIVSRSIDDYIEIGVGVLSGCAIVIGIAALVRHEKPRVAAASIALGGLAIGFQLVTYTIMMFAGGLIIAGVIYAMRDAFGDMFGGLFGQ